MGKTLGQLALELLKQIEHNKGVGTCPEDYTTITKQWRFAELGERFSVSRKVYVPKVGTLSQYCKLQGSIF